MITAYTKPTNFCNVGCTHCYLPESVRADRNRMSFDTLRATARLLADMKVRGRHDGVHILWHGGEPLTVPVDWYLEASEILDEEVPGHTQSIQTALIPLREAYVPLIRERFNAEVGTSLDFSQRMLKGSVEAYHKLWMQKVELAWANNIFVTPGVVPTRREIGREAELVDWFMERGFPLVNIDRYNAYNTYFDDRPSNIEHSLLLVGLFDALMQRMDKVGWAPLIGAIRGAITGVMFGVGGDRWGTTCQSDFVVVEPDGNLNNCTDKATVDDPFSNAHDGFEAFAKSRFRRKWLRVQGLTHKKTHCETCENQSWCKSGCPITPNGIPEGEVECSGYRAFITHVRRYIETGGEATVLAYLRQAQLLQGVDTAVGYGGAPDVAAHAREAALVSGAGTATAEVAA